MNENKKKKWKCPLTSPRVRRHRTTAVTFFCSNKSTVSKQSWSATPRVRTARRKDLMFSICLKGMREATTRGMMPNG
jgi:hypothetical protein